MRYESLIIAMKNQGGESVSGVNFERAAFLREPMPDGLCMSEQKAFLALRFLYAEFDRGVIDKEQAALEKRKLLAQMEHELKIDKLNERIAQLWKRIEQPAREYVFDSTIENADKFYAAVYGLPDDWRVKHGKVKS